MLRFWYNFRNLLPLAVIQRLNAVCVSSFVCLRFFRVTALQRGPALVSGHCVFLLVFFNQLGQEPNFFQLRFILLLIIGGLNIAVVVLFVILQINHNFRLGLVNAIAHAVACVVFIGVCGLVSFCLFLILIHCAILTVLTHRVALGCICTRLCRLLITVVAALGILVRL